MNDDETALARSRSSRSPDVYAVIGQPYIVRPAAGEDPRAAVPLRGSVHLPRCSPVVVGHEWVVCSVLY